jgi:hypothetical protein
MSKKQWLNHFTMALTGVLFLQFSVGNLVYSERAQADVQKLSGLIGDLNPNDPCAWWNTTNPSNCTQGNANNNSPTSSTNPDPWNWGSGNDDPIWNQTGPGNGSWDDPTGTFSSGWNSSGQPQFSWEMAPFKAIIGASYTKQVAEDMAAKNFWDENALASTADSIVKSSALLAGSLTVGATTGIYLLNAFFPVGWKTLLGYGGTLFGETLANGAVQIDMVLELMELYGQLPTEITLRQRKVSAVVLLTVAEALTYKVGALKLKLADIDNSSEFHLPPQGQTPSSQIISDEGLATAGISRGQADGIMGGATIAEKLNSPAPAGGVVGDLNGVPLNTTFSNLFDNLFERFVPFMSKTYNSKFISYLRVCFQNLSTMNKTIMLAGLLGVASGTITYFSTKIVGNHYKKVMILAAANDKLRGIRELQGSPDAESAMWLLLTKYVFRRDKITDATNVEDNLTDDEKKLYAAIVSQEFPLVHSRFHDQAKALFKKYRTSASQPLFAAGDTNFIIPMAPVNGLPTATDKPVVTNKPAPTIKDMFSEPSKDTPVVKNDPFPTTWPVQDPKPAGSANVKFSVEIDNELVRLRDHLHEAAKLYFIRVIYSGMLMKGYPTTDDATAIETIAIELGLTPPHTATTNTLKSDDPRFLTKSRYENLISGLKLQVQQRSAITATHEAAAAAAAEAKKNAKNGIAPVHSQPSDDPIVLPTGDTVYYSGELLMEDFYEPKMEVQKILDYRTGGTNVVDQADKDYYDNTVVPVILGEKKKAMRTTLFPNSTADGSPHSYDQFTGSMMVR